MPNAATHRKGDGAELSGTATDPGWTTVDGRGKHNKPKDAVATADTLVTAPKETKRSRLLSDGPSAYYVYARGDNKRVIAEVVTGRIFWGSLETHPLGMSVVLLDKTQFPSQAVFDAVREAATLVVDQPAALEDHKSPGIVKVWPMRTQIKGEWKTVPRWEGREHRAEEMVDLFRDPNVNMTIDMEVHHGKPVLLLGCPGYHFCEVMERARKFQFDLEVVTVPNLTTAFLEVSSMRSEGCPLAQTIRKHQLALEARYPNIRWGMEDKSFLGFRVSLMIDEDLSFDKCYSIKENGVVAKFYIASASAETPEEISAKHEAKVAELLALRRSELLSAVRKTTGMMTDENDVSSSDEDEDAKDQRALNKAVVDGAMKTQAMCMRDFHKVLVRAKVPSAACLAASEFISEMLPEEALKQTELQEKLKSASSPGELETILRACASESHDRDAFQRRAAAWGDHLRQKPPPPTARIFNPRPPPPKKKKDNKNSTIRGPASSPHTNDKTTKRGGHRK